MDKKAAQFSYYIECIHKKEKNKKIIRFSGLYIGKPYAVK
jgi:hypothetical protein